MCKVDGCNRDSMYKEKDLCQKHYFRLMRNGTFKLKETNDSFITSNGYVVVHRPEHFLARGTGHVLQHREVLYNSIGDTTPDCDLCGCITSWEIYKYHVDHIDENKLNNDINNLRMLCNPCNTGRTKKMHHKSIGRYSITIDGSTMTPQEWSRVDGVKVSGATIINRLKRGFSDYDSVYIKKKTHTLQ